MSAEKISRFVVRFRYSYRVGGLFQWWWRPWNVRSSSLEYLRRIDIHVFLWFNNPVDVHGVGESEGCTGTCANFENYHLKVLPLTTTFTMTSSWVTPPTRPEPIEDLVSGVGSTTSLNRQLVLLLKDIHRPIQPFQCRNS